MRREKRERGEKERDRQTDRGEMYRNGKRERKK